MRYSGLAVVLILAACTAPAVQSSAPASTSAPPSSTVTASPDGISRNEAINLARDALLPSGNDWDVVLAEAGPLSRVAPWWEEQEWGQGLSADVPVWRVVMASGELSAGVVIDAVDGSVYSSIMGIAN